MLVNDPSRDKGIPLAMTLPGNPERKLTPEPQLPAERRPLLQRRISRSRDSSPLRDRPKRGSYIVYLFTFSTARLTPLLDRVRGSIRRMSSYGAIGGDEDELDRLLAQQPAGGSGRPIPQSNMRRSASASDRMVAASPDMRRVPSTSGTRGPYMFTGDLGIDGPMGSNTSLQNAGIQGSSPQSEEAAHRAHNMAIRYRLFNRLDPGGQTLRMPDHVTPAQYFSILPFDDFMDESGKQGSFVTIFSIWNTMMGTSLLAMPWAIEQAGLVLGIFLLLAMGGICMFTAHLVVQSPKGLTLPMDSAMAEFSDVCRFLFGVWGERAAVWFSIVVLLGGVMVYWVLMSNFLYYTGTVVYDALQPNSSTIPIMENKTFTCDIFCPDDFSNQRSSALFELLGNSSSDGSIPFDSIWTLQGTVPLFLALLCFPLLNFKSPTFFTKFNVLGTVSVFYLVCFTTSKLAECGFNMTFFNPESIHNARDLTIGYCLAAGTYTFIGVAFFAAFPVQRSCISDNFLNNFGTGDVLSATARLFLLFQMLTVLPLLCYLIRTQFFYALCGKPWPGLTKVCILNAALVLLAASMAIFYPKVGSILRYVGAATGVVYVFALPCLAYIKRRETLGENMSQTRKYLLYGLIGVGALNALAQLAI